MGVHKQDLKIQQEIKLTYFLIKINELNKKILICFFVIESYEEVIYYPTEKYGTVLVSQDDQSFSFMYTFSLIKFNRELKS